MWSYIACDNVLFLSGCCKRIIPFCWWWNWNYFCFCLPLFWYVLYDLQLNNMLKNLEVQIFFGRGTPILPKRVDIFERVWSLLCDSKICAPFMERCYRFLPLSKSEWCCWRRIGVGGQSRRIRVCHEYVIYCNNSASASVIMHPFFYSGFCPL